jgi:methionyl-tRNA formyltransferase
MTDRIIFFGTEAFSADALRALIASNFNVVAVVTKPDQPKGRGHKLTEPLVKTIAREHDIPVWQPTKLADVAEQITSLQPVAGVLVSYGKIIPQSIIDLFTPGIINVHPSLLSRYRGPSPIEAAIIHHDNQTGVTIMQLSAAMDAGPIYAQHIIPLDHTETKPALYATLSHIGNQLLIDTLPDILSGALTPTPQNDADATYCSLLSKQDGLLNPAELTAALSDVMTDVITHTPADNTEADNTTADDKAKTLQTASADEELDGAGR